MAWAKVAAAGTIRGREDPILLSASYPLEWQDYGEGGGGSYREFRYLAIQIDGSNVVGELR